MRNYGGGVKVMDAVVVVVVVKTQDATNLPSRIILHSGHFLHKRRQETACGEECLRTLVTE
jgi:hypothetical protein